MKRFEISEKVQKNGRRKFKLILHEIYPDSVIDEESRRGLQSNLNGITWIEQYCKNNLDSIKGMSLRAEFLDEERTELCGHGETDIIDGEPIFENAVMIGTFDKGYIDDVINEDGDTIRACIGVGTIDSACYHNLCTKLDEDMANGIYPNGSVEIVKKDDNDGIEYLYGYVENGRIPTEFSYSGYALLGIKAADQEAKLIELNTHKEDDPKMNDAEIKAIVEQVVSELTNHTAELNACKEDYEEKLNEANSTIENLQNEKNEIMADSEKIKEALENCQNELQAKQEELEGLWNELRTLRDELANAQAKERVAELNNALENFTEEEKAFAKDEIEAFNADPIKSEINSVVDKILIEIGRKAKDAVVVVETNSANNDDVEAIFGSVGTVDSKTEDVNIF